MKIFFVLLIILLILFLIFNYYPLRPEIETKIDLLKAASCQIIVDKKLEFLKIENQSELSLRNYQLMRYLCYLYISDEQVLNTINDLKDDLGLRMTREEINNLTENKTGKELRNFDLDLYTKDVIDVFNKYKSGEDVTKLTEYVYKKTDLLSILIINVYYFFHLYGTNILICISIILGVFFIRLVSIWKKRIKTSLSSSNAIRVNKKHSKKLKKK